MSEYFRKYIRREHYPIHPTMITYKTNFINCVLEAFKRRHWKETHTELEWDIYWAERDWIHNKLQTVHLKQN